MATKYARIGLHLSRNAGSRSRLSFNEIEDILGFHLPRSARKFAPWWANDDGGSHSQAKGWMSAGWRTCQVDVPGERVTFERRPATEPEAPTAGVRERGTAFLPAEIKIDVSRLTDAASSLLADYLAEADGDPALALSRVLDDAALTRRRRLIDWFRENSPRVAGDSTDLIREDRDAR